jgi:hypothetical protein
MVEEEEAEEETVGLYIHAFIRLHYTSTLQYVHPDRLINRDAILTSRLPEPPDPKPRPSMFFS